MRLRDVVEMLMGTGLGPGSYAIVSQGQIDAISHRSPPNAARCLKKPPVSESFSHASTRRCAGSMRPNKNAIRVNDLIAELERRVPELDNQVRRAKRYRRNTARVRDLEILSYLRASSSRP